MNDGLQSIVLGTSGLTVLLGAAVIVSFARPAARGDARAERRARRVAWLAIVVQAAHFAEELIAGFPAWFPERLGLAPWPAGFFVAFNLTWLAIWTAASFASGRARFAADAALLFLAIASIANGIAHPLLALREGGYVPGLVTAPLSGVAGLLLWRARWALRASDSASPVG